MKLIHASAHKMITKYGDEVEYARLCYSTSRGTLGQTFLMHRLSPELRELARSGKLNTLKGASGYTIKETSGGRID